MSKTTGDVELRKSLIRLAHANPGIRKDILPILASSKTAGWGVEPWRMDKAISERTIANAVDETGIWARGWTFVKGSLTWEPKAVFSEYTGYAWMFNYEMQGPSGEISESWGKVQVSLGHGGYPKPVAEILIRT